MAVKISPSNLFQRNSCSRTQVECLLLNISSSHGNSIARQTITAIETGNIHITCVLFFLGACTWFGGSVVKEIFCAGIIFFVFDKPPVSLCA